MVVVVVGECADIVVLKTGLISQANGSGYIEFGGVKIACSVYVLFCRLVNFGIGAD